MKSQSAFHQQRLLVIEDDPGIRMMHRMIAQDLGILVAESADRYSVIRQMGNFDPTLILLDLSIHKMDGIEILRICANLKSKASIIVVSGSDERVLNSVKMFGDSLGLNMGETLQKPIGVEKLIQALESGCSRSDEVAFKEFQLPDVGEQISQADLELALERDQLEVHYQPKIELSSGRLAGVEALVRWNCPERGLVPPNTFIPLAENNGLIGEVTDVVLGKAIRQIARWMGAGIEVPTVSVNLSPAQLDDFSLPERIVEELEQFDIAPQRLVLELTEQAAMANLENAVEILARLRLKNVSVSLDDFGAGFSSLSKMYKLPLSELKLDRSLIVDLDNCEDARTVVKALVSLSKTLKLPVCAEGIETESELNFLTSIGCERGQGFHFCRPLPPLKLEGFLTAATHEHQARLSA